MVFTGREKLEVQAEDDIRILCPERGCRGELPLGSEASTPLEVARGTMKLSPCPFHGMVSEFWLEDHLYHPVGLPHCHNAGSRSRILGVVWQIRRKAPLLVGAIPAEGAIRAGAAVAPVAVIGLGAGGSEKIERSDSKEKCGNLRLLSVSRRRTVLPFGVWIWSASSTSAQLVASGGRRASTTSKTEGKRGI